MWPLGLRMGDTKSGRDKKGLDEDRRQREHDLEVAMEELEEGEEGEEGEADRDEEDLEEALAEDGDADQDEE